MALREDWPYPGVRDRSWLAGDPADDALQAARTAVRALLPPPGRGTSSRDDLLLALQAVVELQERLDWALLAVVGEARSARLSWAEVGQALGVSRQAAQQRFAGYVAEALDQAADRSASAPEGPG